jgi:hypothetical protein
VPEATSRHVRERLEALRGHGGHESHESNGMQG